MARSNDTGLKQLENGNWQCRIIRKIDGVQHTKLCRIDERTGLPFTTKKQARDYREYILGIMQTPEYRDAEVAKKKKAYTFSEMWELFLEGPAQKKAPGTIRKYTSVWKNHIEKEFGNSYINGENAVSVAEINNYLADTYYNTDLAHGYVVSFLKVFYLLYGLAYNMGVIDLETLHRYTKNKSSRIEMPEITDAEANELEKKSKDAIYTQGEIAKMAEVFEGTDMDMAFRFGLFCGLRESETMGLMWDDIDWDKKTLTVNKQLIYVNGSWCISPVKTLKSKRVIDIPEDFFKFLKQKRWEVIKEQNTQPFKNRANEIVLDIRGKEPVEVQGANFINRKLYDGLPGKLLTTNSFKFYAKKIKTELGIDFKTHSLRKTHLSDLASKGYPFHALKERAGHIKLDTTMGYYIKSNEQSREKELEILTGLTPIDPIVEITFEHPLTGKPTVMKVKQSEIDKYKKK